MHTALMALGLAVAIAAIWHAPLAAQTEEPYGGPSSIRFMANGMLAPTRSGLVDLTTGAADVAGPCPPGRRCGPSDQRHLTLAPSDLAKLRSLAIEVRAEGLFDTGCIERQRKEAEEEPEKKQAEWKRQHPNGPPMPATILTPPPDPFFASLQIEGVGTVVSAPELGNRKSDARCVTPATQTLWNMVMGL